MKQSIFANGSSLMEDLEGGRRRQGSGQWEPSLCDLGLAVSPLVGVFHLNTEGRETGVPLEHLLQIRGPCFQQDICAVAAGDLGYQIWLVDPACSSIWGLSSEGTSFEG